MPSPVKQRDPIALSFRFDDRSRAFRVSGCSVSSARDLPIHRSSRLTIDFYQRLRLSQVEALFHSASSRLDKKGAEELMRNSSTYVLAVDLYVVKHFSNFSRHSAPDQSSMLSAIARRRLKMCQASVAPATSRDDHLRPAPSPGD
jgi:hypothetical protein